MRWRPLGASCRLSLVPSSSCSRSLTVLPKRPPRCATRMRRSCSCSTAIYSTSWQRAAADLSTGTTTVHIPTRSIADQSTVAWRLPAKQSRSPTSRRSRIPRQRAHGRWHAHVLLGVPIRTGGELIGSFGLDARLSSILGCRNRAGEPFAEQAALAIRVARLLTDTHDALERETAWAACCWRIADQRSTSGRCFRRSSTALPGSRVPTRATSWRRWVGFGMAAYTAGVPTEFRAIIDQLIFEPGRGTITGRVLMERGPVQIVDILADAEFSHPEAQRALASGPFWVLPHARRGSDRCPDCLAPACPAFHRRRNRVAADVC